MLTTNGKSIQQRQVKIAGWAYFLIILSFMLFSIFLGGQYIIMEDSAATIVKMAENAVLVRINCVYEVLMYSAVILLSVSLFEILKNTDRLLARTGMLLRMGEAFMGFFTVLCMLAILSLVDKDSGSGDVKIAVIVYDIRNIIDKLIMIFISLGTLIYCWLFFKSRFIPKFISVWGMVGFFLMLVAGILQILNLEAGSIINIIAAGLVIPFEFVIGLWLIVKGIKVQ